MLASVDRYNRFEKRHNNLPAHVSPCFIGIREGDLVTVGQCRPLSKTVRFNVLEIKKKPGAAGKKAFTSF